VKGFFNFSLVVLLCTSATLFVAWCGVTFTHETWPRDDGGFNKLLEVWGAALGAVLGCAISIAASRELFKK